MMNANTSSLDGIVIRKMAPSDASDAAELSLELGYSVPVDVMEARLRGFARMGGHVVYAACLQDRVVGWIDVGIVHHLQSPPYGEIGGLIVSGNHRGRGIGRKLVDQAEEWIASQKVTTVLVRSQIAREAAHSFYLRLNFSRLKTSAVFTKSLAAS
jgi:GNAT superfamily N-acetyltransferase